jgi:phage-related protein
MARKKEAIKVIFYKSDTGVEPVREWLKKQSKKDKKILGEDIMTVQYRWPLGMPLVRSLGKGLHEIRSHLSDNRIARMFFCVNAGCIILLHGFIKKTQQTPPKEIEIARQRMK